MNCDEFRVREPLFARLKIVFHALFLGWRFSVKKFSSLFYVTIIFYNFLFFLRFASDFAVCTIRMWADGSRRSIPAINRHFDPPLMNNSIFLFNVWAFFLQSPSISQWNIRWNYIIIEMIYEGPNWMFSFLYVIIEIDRANFKRTPKVILFSVHLWAQIVYFRPSLNASSKIIINWRHFSFIIFFFLNFNLDRVLRHLTVWWLSLDGKVASFSKLSTIYWNVFHFADFRPWLFLAHLQSHNLSQS